MQVLALPTGKTSAQRVSAQCAAGRLQRIFRGAAPHFPAGGFE